MNDRSVVSFTLASSRDYKTEEGAYPADFIDCVLWGAPAESFHTLTAKGDTLQVTGRLQTRTYKDKKEVTHKVTKSKLINGILLPLIKIKVTILLKKKLLSRIAIVWIIYHFKKQKSKGAIL